MNFYDVPTKNKEGSNQNAGNLKEGQFKNRDGNVKQKESSSNENNLEEGNFR